MRLREVSPHCRCGEMLVVHRRYAVYEIPGYEPMIDLPSFTTYAQPLPWLRCPKRHWWNQWWHFDGQANFEDWL